MSKRKLLYITFTFYVLFIFLPLMLIIYFPKMMPFKVPFMGNNTDNEGSESTTVKQTTLAPTAEVPSAFDNLVSYEDVPQREISSNYIGDVKRALVTAEAASSFKYMEDSSTASFFSLLEGLEKTVTASKGLVLICLDPAWKDQNIDLSGLFETYVSDLRENSDIYSLTEKLGFINRYMTTAKELRVSPIDSSEELLVAIYSKECL
jgi:hypothetical protein